MRNLDHLDALRLRLSNETARLVHASSPREREFRAGVVASCEREIAGELRFLGMLEEVAIDISADDLMRELTTE